MQSIMILGDVPNNQVTEVKKAYTTQGIVSRAVRFEDAPFVLGFSLLADMLRTMRDETAKKFGEVGGIVISEVAYDKLTSTCTTEDLLENPASFAFGTTVWVVHASGWLERM